MKAQHSITQIASLIGRHKSTISRELRRNAGRRGYRPKQASELAIERFDQSRNAYTVAHWAKEEVSALLRLQWSPEQVASRLSKKRRMKKINDEEIKIIENRLNNRPRKRLGLGTPTEVSHLSLSRVVLRTWIRRS